MPSERANQNFEKVGVLTLFDLKITEIWIS